MILESDRSLPSMVYSKTEGSVGGGVELPIPVLDLPSTRFGENVLDCPVGPNVIIKVPIRERER